MSSQLRLRLSAWSCPAIGRKNIGRANVQPLADREGFLCAMPMAAPTHRYCAVATSACKLTLEHVSVSIVRIGRACEGLVVVGMGLGPCARERSIDYSRICRSRLSRQQHKYGLNPLLRYRVYTTLPRVGSLVRLHMVRYCSTASTHFTCIYS